MSLFAPFVPTWLRRLHVRCDGAHCFPKWMTFQHVELSRTGGTMAINGAHPVGVATDGVRTG